MYVVSTSLQIRVLFQIVAWPQSQQDAHTLALNTKLKWSLLVAI